MELIRCGISAFVFVALIGLGGCSRIPDTVKIGVAQPLTGPLAALGNDMLHGVELAVKEINKDGISIDGKSVRLQVVAVDDQADPEVGAQVAHELAAQRVAAVIGHLNSGVSIRAAPVYAARNIPQLAISTEPQYTQLGFPTTFRLVASDSLQARAMGSYAATLLTARAFAVIDDDSSYGKSLADLAEESLKSKGKTIALRRSLDDRVTDFSALMAMMNGSPIDVIVTTLADFQVLALIDQLARAGLSHIRIVGSDTIKTDKLLARQLPLEVFATSPVLDPLEFYRGKKFVDAFTAAHGHAPVHVAHYAYDAVHVLAAAMRRSGSVDGRVLTRKLRELDLLGPVTSALKFGPDGEQLYGSVGVYRPRNGRWEPLINSNRW